MIWSGISVLTEKARKMERIPFEIIEIGAVKLNSERQIIDQYQVLIQPRVYKKLHHRTREIIQMDMKLLEREGIPFTVLSKNS